MINKDQILYLANLAKIDIHNDVEHLTNEMNKIIDFVDIVKDINVDYEDFYSENKEVFREDIVKNSYSRDEILKNVYNGEDGFFVVPKNK